MISDTRLFWVHQTDASPIPNWVSVSVSEIVQRICEPKFPCHFAPRSIDNRAMAFTYLSQSEAETGEILVQALRTFLLSSIPAEALPVLLVFIDIHATILANCESFFWQLVDTVARESKPVCSVRREDPEWTLAFDGRSIFINAHSRFYELRRSRWAPTDLMLVIQPLDNLIALASKEEHQKGISVAIRKRVLNYDGVPVGKLFGDYYMDEHSSYSSQYWISDEEE